MTKKIAVYGTYEVKVPIDDKVIKITLSGRYEFHGKGKDLYKAVVMAHRFMPKGFVDVAAEEFLEHPERYGYEGEWVEREIES